MIKDTVGKENRKLRMVPLSVLFVHPNLPYSMVFVVESKERRANALQLERVAACSIMTFPTPKAQLRHSLALSVVKMASHCYAILLPHLAG